MPAPGMQPMYQQQHPGMVPMQQPGMMPMQQPGMYQQPVMQPMGTHQAPGTMFVMGSK